MTPRTLAIALFVGLLGACADESFGPSLYTGQSARFDIVTDEHFSAPEMELRYLLVQRERNQQANHFCLVGYQWPDGTRRAAVHWQEGQEILRWEGKSEWADGSFKYADSLFFSKSVDLKEGLVDSTEGIGGSTFLETRVAAEGTIKDCQAHGQKYVIEPFTPPTEEQ